MTCPTCKTKHVYKLSQVATSGRWECKFCPEKTKRTPLYGSFIRAINPGSKGRRTVAHDHDISRRRVAEDGRTVIRI